MGTEKLNILYFHGRTKDNCRYTVAGYVEDNEITLGISICSTQDVFVKSKGRKISTGRLLNQRYGNRGSLKTIQKEDVGNRLKFLHEVIKYNSHTKDELLTLFNLKKYD